MAGSLQVAKAGLLTQALPAAVRFTKAGALTAGGTSALLRFTKTGLFLPKAEPSTVAASASRSGVLPPWTTVTLTAEATAGAGATVTGYRWSALTAGAPVLSNPNIQSPTVVTGLSLTQRTFTYQVVATLADGSQSAPATVDVIQDLAGVRVVGTDGLFSRPGHFIGHTPPPPVIPPALGRMRLSKAVCLMLPPETVPGGPGSTKPTTFYNAFPGGGGQASLAVSQYGGGDQLAIGVDTGGTRISTDGTQTTIPHLAGTGSVRAKQTDGLAYSRNIPGLLFKTCGDGTASGGVFYAAATDTAEASPWVRIDGVVAGSPQLRFTGGNNMTSTYPDGPQGTYPRHYGTIIEVDDQSIAGYILVHVATVNDGAWRIKVRVSDMMPVEQVRYAGTAGKYVRSLKLATDELNPAANVYSRIILNVYSTPSPAKPLLCTNANTGAASPVLATSTITNAPTNVENIGYVNAAGAGTVPLTIAVKNGGVYLSTNAFTAAASAITFTNVARTVAQNDGPEDTVWWASVGCTVENGQHVVMVGSTNTARKVATRNYNTMWRGVVSRTSTTPWSSITWTPRGGSTVWSEQVLGRPGEENLHWLAGTNSPGLYGTAAISHIVAAPTNPARVYAVARGNTFISDNYGKTWYEGRPWGSANHTSLAFDWWTNKNFFATTTGDWPVAASTEPATGYPFETEPHAVMKFSGANANACWFDPKTSELMIGGSTGGSHSVPPLDPGNTVWGLATADYGRTLDNLDATVDYNLNTGETDVAGVRCGINVYGNSGAATQRTIIVGTYSSRGVWWTNNEGASWQRVDAVSGTVHPLRGSSDTYDSGVFRWDKQNNKVYLMDRAQRTVWRFDISTAGAVSAGTKVFVGSWSWSGTAADGVGFIDLDETHDRLWVTTADDVFYINNASTAAGVSGTQNATAIGFQTYYPGEVVGPMVYLPDSDSVFVATQGFTGDTEIYPKNNADGPRHLKVASPTVASSWARGSSNREDLSETRDRGARLGFVTPEGIERNWNGTVVTIRQQGNGVGAWYL